MGQQPHLQYVIQHDQWHHRLMALASLALICSVSMCASAAPVPQQNQTNFSNASQLIQLRLSVVPDWSESAMDWPALNAFYTSVQYRAIWIDDPNQSMDLDGFIGLIGQAHVHGLPSRNYHLRAIQQQLSRTQPEERIWLELLLTDAFLKYATDLGTGHLDPASIDSAWHIERPTLDAAGLLKRIIQHGNLVETLESLAPTGPDYALLKNALQAYRSLRQQDSWPLIPRGPVLERDMRHPHVALLRSRLIAEGDLLPAETVDPDFFDEPLEKALKQFQYRHGLEPDGSFGPESRKTANESIDHRISQIELNLERQRWLPHKRGQLHIEVNLLDFSLDVLESDQPILSMPIIIGTRDRPTPSLANSISYLVLNPEWNIPDRIATEDLIPSQIQDTNFFEKLDIKAMTGWGSLAQETSINEIDWSQWVSGESPYRLVQRAGDKNSLGRIKFMFPNPFHIYLHDTPYPELFNRRIRTFSHGCIRVSRPIALANTLLERLPHENSIVVQDEIKTGETKIIHLPTPVPVYLIYKSVWVDPAGLVHFRDDLYNREQRMMTYVMAQNDSR